MPWSEPRRRRLFGLVGSRVDCEQGAEHVPLAVSMSQAVLGEDAPRAPTVLRLPILLLLALAPPNGAAVTLSSSPCMEIQSQSPCPVCSGTGWKAIESEGVRSVIRCECFQKSKLDRLFQRAGVPPRYQFCAFESFNAMNESVNYAKTIAMKFVEEYPLDFGLLIMGPCGAGKTHLAVSILRELIYQQKTGGVFYDFRDLLKKIQNSYNSISQNSEMEILDPVLNCEVLVLDDLGRRAPDRVGARHVRLHHQQSIQPQAGYRNDHEF